MLTADEPRFIPNFDGPLLSDDRRAACRFAPVLAKVI